jgi:hypothetical protein
MSKGVDQGGSRSRREKRGIGIDIRKDESWDEREVPQTSRKVERAEDSCARKIVRKEFEKKRVGGKRTIVVYRGSARPDSNS